MTDTCPPEHLVTASGRRVAYRLSEGSAPGVVFCPGLKSDMEGTKALALEQWCRARGQACLRFDYSGHGSSDGRFEDGTIGAWKDDALAVLDACSEGPQVVVGSSMGGWIALLIARERPERVAGLVLVAPAPDFTRRMWDEELDAAARASRCSAARRCGSAAGCASCTACATARCRGGSHWILPHSSTARTWC